MSSANPYYYVLQHGTTRRRADLIRAVGPDPDYREPGANTRPDRQFWTVDRDHPSARLPLGDPERYARRKAVSSGEGGPAIVEVEVPDWIVQLVLNDRIGLFHYQSGAVCFEFGCGLDELINEWPNLVVRVRDVTP
ncbi:MAG: hypothetical protein U0871_22330 [Gemmataceae bacterium]